jgi:NSS family neurotransmitter:Na+ symporter
VAFLAGFMIFPAPFSYGIPPDSGPNLLFLTMTQLLSEMPMGWLFGSVFFLILILAGLTSVVTVLECVVQSLMDRFRITQAQALSITISFNLILLIPNILSYSQTTFNDMAGHSFFAWTDFIANSILLPLVGLMLVCFGIYFVGFEQLRKETNRGSGIFKVTAIWKWIWQVVVPASIIIILITGLNS